VILTGGVLAVIGSGTSVPLLREGLRYGCSFALEGEGAGWTCVDGIGYVGAVLGLLGGGALVLAAGLTVVVSRRPRRWQGVVLAALSFVPPIGAAILMLAGVTGASASFPPGVEGADGWIVLVLPSLVVASMGLALAAATANRTGLPGLAVFSVGIVLVVAAIVLQVGMLVACVPAIALAIASRLRCAYVEAIGRFDERAQEFATQSGVPSMTTTDEPSSSKRRAVPSGKWSRNSDGTPNSSETVN
jgi:hypothetical protein